MHRVYYNNEPGDPPRMVTHGAHEFVWQPKGEVWVRELIEEDFTDPDSGRSFRRKRRVWKKTEEKGEPISWIQLDPDQFKEAMKQKYNHDGKLVPEEKLKETLSVKDIQSQILELQALAAEKESEEAPKRKTVKK